MGSITPGPTTDITIRHIVTGHNISTEAVRHAVELSVEKYCPVHVMLNKAATISTSFEVRSEKPLTIAM